MMKNNHENNSLGLYIHIPFCIKKCAYCDFYSVSAKDIHSKYIDALYNQTKNLSKEYFDRFFDTVYIGGGTPTILGSEDLEKLIGCIVRYFNIDKNCEFTIEANPATLDDKKLDVLLNMGVNRLSIGCQSAIDSELKILGRAHCFADFVSTYRLARSAGFQNISVDLMYAIPDQTPESHLESIEQVTQLSPDHISVYGLKIEPNTLFYKKQNEFSFPDEDEYCRMYLEAGELLASKGYKKYEISNYAKAGYESKHNLKYWLMHDYLGIGPGAHSFIDGRRYAYSKNVIDYIEAVNANLEPQRSEDTVISQNDLLNEEFMLNMRLSKGYCIDGRLQLDRQLLSVYERYGYISLENGVIKFTDKGFLISNYLLSQLTNFD